MIQIYRSNNAELCQKLDLRGDEFVFVIANDNGVTGYCKAVLKGLTLELLDLNEDNNDLPLASSLVKAVAGAYRDIADTVLCVSDANMLPALRYYLGCFINGECKIEVVLTGSCV